MDKSYQIDGRAGSTRSRESANRLHQLEALAAATTRFSPELLSLIQQERLRRMIELSNALLHSPFIRDAGDRSTVAPTVPAASRLYCSHPTMRTFMEPTALPNPMLCDPVNSTLLSSTQSFPVPPDHVQMPTPTRFQLHALSELLSSVGPQASDHGLKLQQHSESLGVSRVAVPAISREALSRGSSDDEVEIDQVLDRAVDTVGYLKQPRKKPCLTKPARKESTHNLLESNSPASSKVNPSTNRRRYCTEAFPNRLLRMIETAKSQGHDHLIKFAEDGKSIIILNSKELAAQNFPLYFVSTV